MQIAESNLVVLAGAVDNSHKLQMHYGLVTLKEVGTTFDVKAFCQMKCYGFYNDDPNDECLKMRFIYNRSIAYVYGNRLIHEIILNGKCSWTHILKCWKNRTISFLFLCRRHNQR